MRMTRDEELEDESVAVLVDAVSHGDASPETLRRNLEADEQAIISATGSELRDLQYRIAVRKRVLAATTKGELRPCK